MLKKLIDKKRDIYYYHYYLEFKITFTNIKLIVEKIKIL